MTPVQKSHSEIASLWAYHCGPQILIHIIITGVTNNCCGELLRSVNVWYLKTPLDFNSWLKTFFHLVAVALAMFLTCLLTHLYLLLRVDKGNISVKILVMCMVTVQITFVVSNSNNTGNVYGHRTDNFYRIQCAR
jgi:hypothetical protein